MKSLLAALAATVTITLAGCGQSSSSGCVNASCGGNSSTYQVCPQGGDTASYNFGGASCSCSPSSGCTECFSKLASFCGDLPPVVDASLGTETSTGTDSGGSDSTTGDAGGDASSDSAGGGDTASESGGGNDAAADTGSDAAGDTGGPGPDASGDASDAGDAGGSDASPDADGAAPTDSGGG